MSTRIVTLFGEEIVPEPQKPAARGRAKKSEKDAGADEPGTQPEQAPASPEIQAAQERTVPEAQAPTPVEQVAAEPEPRTFEAPTPAETPAATGAEADRASLPDEPAATPPKKSRKRTGDDGMLAKPETEIIPEDWSGDKKYYTIGEVAGFFKVATSHIRFWTNEFKLKVRTTRKGDRLYTPDQVKELRAIYHLVKERGFTLSGARTKLKEQNKRDVTTVDLKTSLQELRARLVILRDQLI